MRVLYICTGNGYRSPMAEALTREYTGFEVESAGVDPGREIPVETRKLLEERGAQQFVKPKPDNVSQRALEEADKIVCMTSLHSEYVKRNFNVKPEKIEVWNVEDPVSPGREAVEALKEIDKKVQLMDE